MIHYGSWTTASTYEWKHVMTLQVSNMTTLPLFFFHTRSRGHATVGDMVNNNDERRATLRLATWLPSPSFPFFTKEAGPHRWWQCSRQQTTHNNHEQWTMSRWVILLPSLPPFLFSYKNQGPRQHDERQRMNDKEGQQRTMTTRQQTMTEGNLQAIGNGWPFSLDAGSWMGGYCGCISVH